MRYSERLLKLMTAAKALHEHRSSYNWRESDGGLAFFRKDDALCNAVVEAATWWAANASPGAGGDEPPESSALARGALPGGPYEE